jgi:hypothetical protein
MSTLNQGDSTVNKPRTEEICTWGFSPSMIEGSGGGCGGGSGGLDLKVISYGVTRRSSYRRDTRDLGLMYLFLGR